MHIFKKNEHGDTLIEVVLSITILSTVIVSALNIANLTYRIGVQARERTEAIHLAQMQAERLIALRDREMNDPAVRDLSPYETDNSLFELAPLNGVANTGAAFHITNALGLAAGNCTPADCGSSRYTVNVTSRTSGNPYTIASYSNPAAPYNPPVWMRATVTVTWDSLIGSGAGEQNIIRFPLWLADKRGNTLADCTAKRGVADPANERCAYVNGTLTPTGPPPPPPRFALYQLWNNVQSDHFYTTSVTARDEADSIHGYELQNGDGIAGYLYESEQPNSDPVIQLYSFTRTDHFYTTSESEATTMANPTNGGYIRGGIIGYIPNTASTPGTAPFYQLYSSITPDHFYTRHMWERTSAEASFRDYQFQRILGYIFTGP